MIIDFSPKYGSIYQIIDQFFPSIVIIIYCYNCHCYIDIFIRSCHKLAMAWIYSLITHTSCGAHTHIHPHCHTHTYTHTHTHTHTCTHTHPHTHTHTTSHTHTHTLWRMKVCWPSLGWLNNRVCLYVCVCVAPLSKNCAVSNFCSVVASGSSFMTISPLLTMPRGLGSGVSFAVFEKFLNSNEIVQNQNFRNQSWNWQNRNRSFPSQNWIKIEIFKVGSKFWKYTLKCFTPLHAACMHGALMVHFTIWLPAGKAKLANYFINPFLPTGLNKSFTQINCST